METFTVLEVIDGDTFIVEEGWEWNNKQGSKIRPTGYDTPEKGERGYQAAKNKLKNLIEGKKVKIGNAVKTSYDRLLADVYFEGKYLANYFPKYKK